MRTQKKTILLSAGLLAGVALATLATHSVTLNAANRAVAAAIAATPGVHAGTIAADPFSGKLVLTDVAFDQNGLHLHADRLALPLQQASLALIPAAFALDGGASMDNLTIEAGPITYVIKHVEASGTSMTAADFATLLDAKSGVPATERLAKFNAAAITIPEVVGSVKIGELSEKITYHNVKFANVVNGKIGTASVADAAVWADVPNVGVVSGVLTNMATINMDLVQAARVMTQARTGADEPLQTIYDSFSTESFVLKGLKDVNLSTGRITGKGFKARPFAQPYGEVIAKLGAMSKTDQPSPEQMKEFSQLYFDMLKSFEIGGMEMRDFVIAAEADGKPVAFKLARVAMNGMAGGKLGEVAYDGFDMAGGTEGGQVKVKFGNFSIRGFDFRPLMAMSEAFAAVGEAAFSDPAEVRKFVPTFDHIGISGLEIDVPTDNGMKGNANDGKNFRMQLGGLSFDASGFIVGVPTAATLAMDHLTMDLTGLLGDPDMKDFAALGYKSVDISSKVDLGWVEAANELRLKALSFDSAGMGSLLATATLSNVPKGLFSTNISMIMGAALGAVVTKVEVSVVNNGIIEKGLAAQAAKTQSTPDKIRQAMAAGAAQHLPEILGNAPSSKVIAAALAKFLANPKSLKLTATSADGLGAGDMGLVNSPVELLKKIEVKASVNE